MSSHANLTNARRAGSIGSAKDLMNSGNEDASPPQRPKLDRPNTKMLADGVLDVKQALQDYDRETQYQGLWPVTVKIILFGIITGVMSALGGQYVLAGGDGVRYINAGLSVLWMLFVGAIMGFPSYYGGQYSKKNFVLYFLFWSVLLSGIRATAIILGPDKFEEEKEYYDIARDSAVYTWLVYWGFMGTMLFIVLYLGFHGRLAEPGAYPKPVAHSYFACALYVMTIVWVIAMIMRRVLGYGLSITVGLPSILSIFIILFYEMRTRNYLKLNLDFVYQQW